MRAPEFWQEPKGMRSAFLLPLASFYSTVTALRLRRGKRYDPGVPPKIRDDF